MKRNKYITLAFIFTTIAGTFFCACSDRPSGVLKEDKMVKLLADMQLAEAYENNNPSPSQEKLELGQQILEYNGISAEELDTTLAWYGRNIDEYSELFDKVDKEILKRKKKYTINPSSELKVSDNLWPYSTHLQISPLSGYESFMFSLPDPDIEKGEVVKLSFSLPNPANLKGTFGVEYSDGYGESSVSTFTNKRSVEIELQTDSSKKVSRLFGFMTLKDVNSLPLYIDSISIKTEELDTLSYRSKRRQQKEFGALRPRKEPDKPIENDSVLLKIETDSISMPIEPEIHDPVKIDENLSSPPVPRKRVTNKTNPKKTKVGG